jgi:hypothetical protein
MRVAGMEIASIPHLAVRTYDIDRSGPENQLKHKESCHASISEEFCHSHSL